MKNSNLVRKIFISAFSLSILLSANGCVNGKDLIAPVQVPVNNSVNVQSALPAPALKLKGPEVNKNRNFKSVEDIGKEILAIQEDNKNLVGAGIKPVVNKDGSQSVFMKNPDGSPKGEIRLIQKGNIKSGLIFDKDGYLVARITEVLTPDNVNLHVYEDSRDEYLMAVDGDNVLNTVLADNLDGTVTIIERDQFSKEISRKVINKPAPFLSKFDDKTGLYLTSNLNEDGSISVLEVDRNGNVKKRIEDKSFLQK